MITGSKLILQLNRCWLLLVLLMCVWTVVYGTGESGRPQKRVLVLYANRKDSSDTLVSERIYQRMLKDGLSETLDYYSENLDVGRFAHPDTQKALHDFLLIRYKGLTFDLIISTTTSTNEFVLRYRSELFSGCPIVFGLDNLERLDPNSTGVFAPVDLKGTVEVALQLQPDAKRVYIVNGASEYDEYYESLLKKQLSSIQGRVEFVYLHGLELNNLLRTVSNLPPHSLIYLVSVTEDATGSRFLGMDVRERVASVANAPLYAWHEASIDHGTVGGSLRSSEVIATQTAELALRVLRGEKPQSIPIKEINANLIEVDWRQLQRWGISEKRLPAGTIVRFRQPTIWEQYKWRILAVVLVLILQSLLIIYLLMNRTQRKRAQEERERFATLAEAEHRHLDEVVANVPGIVWERLLDPDGSTMGEPFVSQYIEKMLGYTVQEWLSKPQFWLSIIPEQQREPTQQRVNEIFTSGKDGAVQFQWTTKTNRLLWVEAHLSVIFDEHGSPVGLRGVTLDITDRKAAEEGMRNALAEVRELKDQLQEENIYLREQVQLDHEFEEIVGNSDGIKYVLYKIQQVAPTDTAVLVLGETGTGKELVARAIHGASARKDRPLVKINCATLPATLIESELFGHEKGAFTGAQTQKIGRFEMAEGATLFLDEIGELPLELQSKLLRVLQEGEFERLGSSKTQKVDVRIIAATNRDLKVEVQNGLFREDLWYRLNVFPITVPPLRHRKSDIALLVNFFVDRSNRKLGRIVKTISPRTLRTLENYAWPGNIRELANVVERAIISSPGTVLQLAEKLESSFPLTANDLGNGQSIAKLEDVERNHIVTILAHCEWRIEGLKGAANMLGINSSTLRSRMNKLGIKKPNSAAASSSGPTR